MCGIFSIVLKTSSIDKSTLSRIGQLCLSELKLRGPDSLGFTCSNNLFLGHTRLSINDLSDFSAQPFPHSDEHIKKNKLIFNGEIFNFRSVADEIGLDLKLFSDTNLLYEFIEKKGFATLKQDLNELNGMWSFIHYDHMKNEIIYSRDRYGEKPLFMYESSELIIFSSEISPIRLAISHLEGINFELDKKWLCNYIENGSSSVDDSTPFPKITAVEPGLIGQINLSTFDSVSHKYYQPDNKSVFNGSYNEAVNAFTEIFESAVNLRGQADVPVGVALSGGLDSTCVLAAFKKTKPSTTPLSFTSVFPGSASEVYWAKVASDKASVPLKEVETSTSNWKSSVALLQKRLGFPINSPAVIPHYNLMLAAKQTGYKVILEGQGADELFAGYSHHHCKYALDLLVYFKWGSAALFLKTAFNQHGAIFFTQMFLKYALQTVFSVFKSGKYSSLKEVLGKDFTKNILPPLLHYGDICSMTASVENRNPFLDYRLVEFAESLPLEYLFDKGRTKPILRDYLINNGYYESALRVDKKGYVVPDKDIMFNNKKDFNCYKSIVFNKMYDVSFLCKLQLSKVNMLSKYTSIFGFRRSFYHLYKFVTLGAFISVENSSNQDLSKQNE